MNRAIHVRLFVALAIAGAVSALAFSATHSPEAPLAARTTPAAVDAASAPMPILPTIVVHANDDVPILPLVIVRPGAEELAAAFELASNDRDLPASGSSSDSSGGFVPRARIDMPFYSFGALIPGTNKD